MIFEDDFLGVVELVLVLEIFKANSPISMKIM